MGVLSTEEQAVVDTVRDFVDREVKPAVHEVEQRDEYPEKWIEQMKELGIYGLAIPEPWGEAPVSMPCATPRNARASASRSGSTSRSATTSPTWPPRSPPRASSSSTPRGYDAGERCDMEAGMAKLFTSEIAMEVALNAVRIHGGYGYSTELDVERYYRDAPLMIVGEAPTRSSTT